MMSQEEIASAATQGRWKAFYERLRADMIEAQCALESGKPMRASELIDGVMRHAAKCERTIYLNSSGQTVRRRRIMP